MRCRSAGGKYRDCTRMTALLHPLGARCASTAQAGTITVHCKMWRCAGTRMATPPWGPPPGPTLAAEAATSVPGNKPLQIPMSAALQWVSCRSTTLPSAKRPQMKARLAPLVSDCASMSHRAFHEQTLGAPPVPVAASAAATCPTVYPSQRSPQVVPAGHAPGRKERRPVASQRALGERTSRVHPTRRRCVRRAARHRSHSRHRAPGTPARRAGQSRASHKGRLSRGSAMAIRRAGRVRPVEGEGAEPHGPRWLAQGSVPSR